MGQADTRRVFLEDSGEFARRLPGRSGQPCRWHGQRYAGYELQVQRNTRVDGLSPDGFGAGGSGVGRVDAGGNAVAQENPLDRVNTQEPPPPAKSAEDKRPVIEGAENAVKFGTSHRDARIRVDVNLVLVPMTVTDPMNRLVTGLERENFQVFDNNVGQTIRSFSTEDAPVTIGIVFDLSGSMTTKFTRARKALSQFLTTCNPQDEFSWWDLMTVRR